MGCRGAPNLLKALGLSGSTFPGRTADRLGPCSISESEMPKIKSKSAAKKRFRFTATGKVISAQAGKRHGMIKRSNKQIRNQRGTTILTPADTRIVRTFLPYG
jgi:large subunit ribosomal protein L35